MSTMYSKTTAAFPRRNAVTRVAATALCVQWNNGKNTARRQGEPRFSAHVGFFAQTGKDGAFDAWCAAIGVPQIQVRHPRAGQAAEVVLHWDLGEDIRFFPLTAGPVASTVAASVSARYQQATAEAGIALRWGTGTKSKMAIRGYVSTRGAVYTAPVELVARGLMTERLLSALVRHVEVCQAADSARQPGAGSGQPTGLWELALPLGAGEEENWGRGQTTAVVPFVCKHPTEISAEYLASLYRPDELVQAAARDWAGVLAWALEYAFYQAEDRGEAQVQPEQSQNE
jgi:hypothetical protein